MGTLTIKSQLENYFLSNWTTTTIQFDGVPFNYATQTSWISLVYHPAINTSVTKSGSATCAIRREGILKVFCYAKSVPKAFTLSDAIQTFLNNKNILGVQCEIGVDGTASNLANGFFEVPVTFAVTFYE